MVSLLASTNIKVILITCLLSFLCHSANTHTHHSNNTITIDIANRNDVTTNLHRYLRRSWFQFFNSFRSVCTSAAAFNVCRGSDELFSLAILRFCHSVWHYTITYWFLIGIRASSHCVDSALQSTRQPIDDRALFFFSFVYQKPAQMNTHWIKRCHTAAEKIQNYFVLSLPFGFTYRYRRRSHRTRAASNWHTNNTTRKNEWGKEESRKGLWVAWDRWGETVKRC